MTRKQLTRTVKMLMDLDLEFMEKKNHDYSTAEDALSNFKDFGWRGIVVRIGDKYKRLREMAQGKEPKNEAVIDSFIDLCIYGYLARVVYLNENSVVNSKNTLKSSCCDADITITGEGTTQLFQCTECGEPCDIK